MEPKKNPNVEIGRNSSLYFAVGLNIMLFVTWMLIEHKSYEKSNSKFDIVYVIDAIEEDIPITEIKALPPPPPPAPAIIPDAIKVVKDEIEVVETILESTEIQQDVGIEDRKIVEIEEVEVEEIEEDIEVPFAVVEQVPIFPGCSGNNTTLIDCFKSKMTQHVKNNLKYPERAIENNMYGKVFVMFTIDKEGNITDIRSRGPYKILESEAERIINLLPKMEPAKQRGRPVKISYSLPITFKYLD